MKTILTHATEDYLKAIYTISVDGLSASTNALAERLKIAPASVTGMIKRLAETSPPLVDYRKHYGVTLTPAGERAALKVIRQHRLLETYLHESLGFSWDEVHEEACRMEHVISDAFSERIDAILGHPTHDPHGDPIPDLNLVMPQKASTQLSALRPPQKATIQRVDAKDGDLLRFLEEKGLVPGSKLETRAYSPFDGNLTILLNEQEMILGPAITRHVFIEEN
ncbi:MAG: metal-dependent transcriptional regulator [Anaerolineae bacterium]|jgi:DtxR family Mn-dependent transcriptional regulator|nr:metal-dependent transcriptional regulator [Anaerolineae bacterium]MBT4312593.1 metal-dependent transcriptional regulator [Anaerolineae bacterium]MBT4456733.1 metal-dependent transcriptional regulator [Anaerolineae bacterium]MBT6060921.1 metal-dependent transcriptional regulator [Anaerolineae bacterium]MBT6324242.1 metal-dependent transcriptional regulator [Anaerolineae bacterium]